LEERNVEERLMHSLAEFGQAQIGMGSTTRKKEVLSRKAAS
jgi:hypothetical protein